jgi:hypothetical protein
MIFCGMLDLCRIIFEIVVDLFRPRAALEPEILVLRQQIIVLRRGRPSQVPFRAIDRMVLGWVCQLFPKTREALAIVRPDTVVRWHRAGFRCYWRWKSRPRPGRPAVPAEIRQFIRQMSIANPLWGAPRIHGELLKLGIIGSIRRECLDHIVVTGEQHLRHILKCYLEYYNAVRTHLSLGKDAPICRDIQHAGRIEVRPVLGGLHHQYGRI